MLALDTRDLDQARRWAGAAGDAAGLVKVGLELWSAQGPAAVAALVADGHRVMLDLKLHDIPNTVAGAVTAVAALGAELLTVHATGGTPMLEAAARAAKDATGGAAGGAAGGADGGMDLAAVTVLTSLGAADAAAVGLGDPAEAVPRLARLAVRAGCRALVCSPREAAAVRQAVGPDVRLICPGVRPLGAATGDQARTATPAAALAAGADLLVVGRPITAAADVVAAARAVRDEALAAVRDAERATQAEPLAGDADRADPIEERR
jgi:orotidine-5'-phosphate decarboxylase